MIIPIPNYIMDFWEEIKAYDKEIDNLKSMENVICAVAKNENDYINDWCQYHFKLGYSDIFIYDNNPLNAEPVENFIDSSIRSKVHILKIPNAKEFQKRAYLHFYRSFSNLFNTVTIIDIDEFMVLNKWDNIQSLVSDPLFNKANVIRLNWVIYTDNNLIKKDLSKPVWERFNQPTPSKWRKNHAKCIIRGGLKKISFKSVHHPLINNKADKEYCIDGSINANNSISVDKEYKDAYIKHFMTKSLQEFIECKINRGDAELPINSQYYFFKENNLKNIFNNYYFKINEKTPEKIEFIKNHFQIDI